MKTLAVTNAASQLNVTFVLKPSFMQSMEAWQAGLLAFMLDSFVFILIGFLLLAIGLLFNRMAALILCAEHGINLAGESPVTGIYRQV